MSSTNQSTRTRILAAAWKLLEADTPNTVRMSDIAKAAGISRQAVYLHFSTRAELLISTTQFVDEAKKVEERLRASREATTGIKRLDAYIHAWGNYIPEIYGIGRALLSMSETDEEAAAAWNDRMQAVRHGCVAVIAALKADGHLTADYSEKQAADVLWTMLSVRNWEQLVRDEKWTQARYVKAMRQIAMKVLVSQADN